MEITLSLLLIILILYWIYLYQKYKIEHFTKLIQRIFQQIYGCIGKIKIVMKNPHI